MVAAVPDVVSLLEQMNTSPGTGMQLLICPFLSSKSYNLCLKGSKASIHFHLARPIIDFH